MKKSFILSSAVLILLILTLAFPAYAAQDIGTLEGWAPMGYVPDLSSSDISSNANLITKLVSTGIGILTIIGGGMTLVMFFLGGMRWLSSSGNPENIERAKKQLTYSAIGMILIVAAYGFTFIIGLVMGVDILNFGKYLAELGPQGSASITSLSPAYYPETEGAPNKLNLIFSAAIGALTLFGGLFFIVYFLLGALQWVTSGGVPERIEKAKKQLTNATIGFIVVIAAYAVMYIVGSVLGVELLNPDAAVEKLLAPGQECKGAGSVCTPGGAPCCEPWECRGGVCVP